MNVKINKRKIAYILCLIMYYIVIFGTEILYREKLYKTSVKYERKIKQSGFLHYFYFFWSYIFIYGMMVVATIIVMVLYPYNVFICYASIEISLIFIMCFLKSIYSNERPYWDIYNDKLKNNDESTKPTECDGGFGNPSGHSLMSTSFLNLWYLFINSLFLKKFQKKWRILIAISSLILVIVCILSVTFSRIHRQIHSFNQIIFGTLIGIGIFFLFCFILEFNEIQSKDFFNILNKYKYILIPIFLILFAISVTFGYIFHNKNEDEYTPVLQKFCKFRKEQIFGKNTAFHSGLIFIIIGGYIGILFLIYNINNKYYNNEAMFYNWNVDNKLKTLKIALFSFVLPAIPLVAIFIIPYRFFIVKFILEVLLYCWYGFGAFGLCFYYGCILFTKVSIEEKGVIPVVAKEIQIQIQ